jgi:elongator complex protein 3
MLDIRSREIKNAEVKLNDLELKVASYPVRNSFGDCEEQFLEFTTADDKVCGFLRLSLPLVSTNNHFISELSGAAIIREIHVYGVARNFGDQSIDSAQHLGLGKKLLTKAIEIAKLRGFHKLSVISAIGTKEYYRHNGFQDGNYYQHYYL